MQFKTAISTSQILLCIRDFIKTECTLPATLPEFITRLDAPEFSEKDSLTFVSANLPLHLKSSLHAALVISEVELSGPWPIIQVQSVFAAMEAVLLEQKENRFPLNFRVTGADNNVHPTAVVEGVLCGHVTVGAGAYIGKHSVIDEYTHIEANASILDYCHIGKHCLIQSGAVVGCAGFGFYQWNNRTHAIPHVSGVILGDEVWVGAQTVIASGVLHPTTIGDACKLDSHVQIAHNVKLGKHAFLASQSGVAGSTQIGDFFRMGGNASVAGHLQLGNNVSVAACSGVTKSFPDGSILAGFPARPKRTWLKQQARQSL